MSWALGIAASDLALDKRREDKISLELRAGSQGLSARGLVFENRIAKKKSSDRPKKRACD